MTGVWGIGVATRNCDVQKVPLGCDSDSWVLRHDGCLCHNNTEVSQLLPIPEEGDIIVSVYCSRIYMYGLNDFATHGRCWLGGRNRVKSVSSSASTMNLTVTFFQSNSGNIHSLSVSEKK